MALKRDIIMIRLIERLKTIVAPGYYTDIRSHVFEYRTTILEDPELPALNVFDNEETKGTEFAGNPPLMDRNLRVTIELLLKEGSLSIQAARRGLADIEKAIGSDITFGGAANYTDFAGSSITIDQKTNIVTGAKLTIMIEYRTTKWAEE
jgi:hypothetical protein